MLPKTAQKYSFIFLCMFVNLFCNFFLIHIVFFLAVSSKAIHTSWDVPFFNITTKFFSVFFFDDRPTQSSGSVVTHARLVYLCHLYPSWDWNSRIYLFKIAQAQLNYMESIYGHQFSSLATASHLKRTVGLTWPFWAYAIRDPVQLLKIAQESKAKRINCLLPLRRQCPKRHWSKER